MTLKDYRPLHPRLREFTEADLRPAFRDSVEEVHADIYTFRPFADAWIAALLEEVLHAREWAARSGVLLTPPNSMNSYGVILADIGLAGAMDAVMRLVVRPLAAELFPEVGGAHLDNSHGFTVEYRRGGDLDLGFHVDHSEVTLNLCLGRAFTGGDLYFQGRRCGLHRQTACSSVDTFDYSHSPGVALLHAGKHRHGAYPVESGERLNLILWCRSRGYQLIQRGNELDGACPDWCRESRDRW